MGCDIHTCLEVRKDGKWAPLARMLPNKWYDKEAAEKAQAAGEEYWETPEIVETIYDGRNYSLFAMLADVRNGRGFAGSDTGDGFLPIAFPKGIPDDAHPNTIEFLNSYGVDGHSHTWHTLAALEKYNWDMVTKRRGIANAIEYAIFLRRGRPLQWSSGVFGGSIRYVSNEEMAALCQLHKAILDPIADAHESNDNEFFFFMKARELPEELQSVFTKIQWEEPYRDCASSFLDTSIPRLRGLAEEEGVGPEDIRICMFFDN